MNAEQIAALIRGHHVHLVTARCACGVQLRPRHSAAVNVQQLAVDHVAAVLADAFDIALGAATRVARGAASPAIEPMDNAFPVGGRRVSSR